MTEQRNGDGERVDGVRVLITGGTSGLGAAMARALVKAGSKVAVTGRDQASAEAVAQRLSSTGHAVGIGLDVRDEGSVERVARVVVPRMLATGSGRIVNISMNHETMKRAGFVPYGPARAGAEALSRIMAADLAGSGVTVNILLPGGATATGMVPENIPASLRPHLLDASVMGRPIRWLCSTAATGVHDQRIVATGFEGWLDARSAANPE